MRIVRVIGNAALSLEPLDRRAFIRGAAGAGLALPFLASLAEGGTRKPVVAAAPRCFLAVFSPRGRPASQWYPALPEAVKRVRLADIAGPISPILSDAALDRFRDRLLLLRGLDYVDGEMSGTHYAPFMLNCYYKPKPLRAGHDRFMATLDQVLASCPRLYESPPRLRSLHLKVQAMSTPSSTDELETLSLRLAPSGLVEEVPHLHDPRAAFDLVFGGQEPDSPRQRRRRQLVVDRVLGDVKALLAHPRLSSDDRETLERHLAQVHELERRLQAGAPADGCVLPERSVARAEYGFSDLPDVTRCQRELVVAALSCGLTRVATLMLEAGDHTLAFAGVPDLAHHAVSHGTGANWVDCLRRIDAWYAGQFAALLEDLDGRRDSATGESLLDRTLVFWGGEFGDGLTHLRYDLPALLAGGGGALDLGHYVDYRSDAPEDPFGRTGRPYNELLISLMLAMGLTPADWERGGEAGFGYYGVNSHGRSYDLGDRRSPLPGLLKPTRA